jgi:nucleoside recognition membrane protein YjiH
MTIITLAASHDMSDKIKLILGSIVAVLFGLSALSRRFPQVGWLQHFYFELPELSEQQKAKMRRRAAFQVGAQLILLGIVLPLGYIALTVMMFNDLTRKAMALVLTASVVCIGLGITAIVRGYRG